jgi:hypothetical protein
LFPDDNLKPFQCAHCEKVFSRRDSLTRHLRLHSDSLIVDSPNDAPGPVSSVLATRNEDERDVETGSGYLGPVDDDEDDEEEEEEEEEEENKTESSSAISADRFNGIDGTMDQPWNAQPQSVLALPTSRSCPGTPTDPIDSPRRPVPEAPIVHQPHLSLPLRLGEPFHGVFALSAPGDGTTALSDLLVYDQSNQAMVDVGFSEEELALWNLVSRDLLPSSISEPPTRTQSPAPTSQHASNVPSEVDLAGTERYSQDFPIEPAAVPRIKSSFHADQAPANENEKGIAALKSTKDLVSTMVSYNIHLLGLKSSGTRRLKSV